MRGRVSSVCCRDALVRGAAADIADPDGRQ